MERRSTKRNTNPELTEAERRQADRAFWEQQGDPLQIEREEAIKLAKKFKNPSTNVDTHNTHNETNNMLLPHYSVRRNYTGELRALATFPTRSKKHSTRQH